MNRFNPDKLLMSKWTANTLQNREKHFLITRLLRDEGGVVQECVIEAVLTHREQVIPWQILKDDSLWKQGWK